MECDSIINIAFNYIFYISLSKESSFLNLIFDLIRKKLAFKDSEQRLLYHTN